MIKKLSVTAGWLGAGLSVAGLILFSVRPEWALLVTSLELTALVLLIFFFTIHFETVKNFSTRRSTKLGFNSLLMTILFVSILGIINFIASRHNQRLDLSEIKRFTLAPQTVKLLEKLDRKVKVTGFTQSQTQSKDRIKDLLDSYTYHTDLISYELVDPDKKPAIAKRYGITQYGTLVLESGTQETQIKDVSEQELTNAIIRVSRDAKRSVLFLKEHGEHRLDDTDKGGYSQAKEALEKQGYEVRTLSLLQEGKVPENTSVLVIAGAQKPFLPGEITAMTSYLERGGKLLALSDPQTETNLEELLRPWGIRLGKGIIIDTVSRLFGGDFTVPIVNTYPSNEITQGFNLATFFPVAQTIVFESSRPELEFHEIAKTTPNSWLKTNLSTQDLKFDAEEDIQGPLTIAGLVTWEITEDNVNDAEEESSDISKKEGNLAVFGDSDFASNGTFYFSGNGDLFLNTINYLAKEKYLIAITPKEHRFSPLFLSKIQGQILMYVSFIVIPIAVLISGIGVWRHRRRL